MSVTKLHHGIDGFPAVEVDDLDVSMLSSLSGGEPRHGTHSGIKALMVAVLEDGIRCFLSPVARHRHQAEIWLFSRRTRSPFAFDTVCEILGLDAGAVRSSLRTLAASRTPLATVRGRSRPNVRRTTQLGTPIRRRQRALRPGAGLSAPH